MRMMNLDNIVGIVAGIFTSISLLPQLIKMIRQKKATDISLKMLLTLLAGLALWVWYGIMKMDWPIIITNCFSVVVNVLILLFRWRYKNNSADDK